VKKLKIDLDYLVETLMRLLAVPSPCGFTDQVVHCVGEELERLGIPFELTRRGAIRADMPGGAARPARAIVAHLDTLGAMVRQLKPNGRLALSPIGTWSSRFAEGARVTISTEVGPRRGSVLPLLASGHAYGDAIDVQPSSWQHIEVRVDEVAADGDQLHAQGFRVGDPVHFDPNPEVTRSGFIVSRHLDDKAGVAALLAAAHAVCRPGCRWRWPVTSASPSRRRWARAPPTCCTATSRSSSRSTTPRTLPARTRSRTA
jgi:putative aminopeptidase FrvX